ncbi:GntR family transcriptional regulator [Oceaniglobus indicus]|uniref:GntR family transcriptional regulator n=1 Tax=Oceaniglobus indicus TaxID=2047749 RepID=UPI000C185D57|nr:GntR family transcriptional regulator [Oceaniglobus indicus]
MAPSDPLTQIDPVVRPTIADQVFDALYARVLSLDLPPLTKLSEAEVARQMGVSRQPVRDAFYRLSKLGFLIIQPQRATTVSQISARDVSRARFIRSTIEIRIVRRASGGLADDDIAALERILSDQLGALEADERARFHRLDDAFHQRICEAADLGFAWDVIRETRAHTDRVRYLSLGTGSRRAYEDHRRILDSIIARDADGAERALDDHLAQIDKIVAGLRARNPTWFSEEE